MESSYAVEKPDLEVLSQEIDDDTSSYRIRTGKRVRYLKIAADVFDIDKICRPYLLLPRLLT